MSENNSTDDISNREWDGGLDLVDEQYSDQEDTEKSEQNIETKSRSEKEKPNSINQTIERFKFETPKSTSQIDSEFPFIYSRKSVGESRSPIAVSATTSTEQLIRRAEILLGEHFPDDDVPALDIREATLIAGLRNIEEIVSVMEEWGYGKR